MEMNRRFSELNSQLVEALCALDPDSPHFLDVQKVKPLLELTNTALVESELFFSSRRTDEAYCIQEKPA